MKKSTLNLPEFITGAKKAMATTTLTILCLTTAMPITAHADVPPSYITGDLQTTEDRTEIKNEETQAIIAKFNGFDQNGYQTITMEEIEKAIRLSDALNAYLYDPLKFTNARSSEVINLDINEIYDYYVRAYQAGTKQDEEYFYKNTLPYKPAIDAYITFVCGTVSNNIKGNISYRLCEVIDSEGRKVTSSPKIIVNNHEIYALVEVEGCLEKYCLVGDGSEEVRKTCLSLDNIYNMAINSISGASQEHDNTFMYNGIDSITNESAWLSLPDEEKKSKLEESIAIYRNLLVQENYELICANPTTLEPLTQEEQKELRNLAYAEDQIASAGKKEVSFEKVYNKILKKLN